MTYGKLYSYKRTNRRSFKVLGILNLAVMLVLLVLYVAGNGIISKANAAGAGKDGETVQSQTDMADTGADDADSPGKAAPKAPSGAARPTAPAGAAPSNSAGAQSQEIKAPFDGYIGSIFVEPGQYVEKGDPLFVVTDTSKLKILLQFNSVDAENIKAGQKAIVTPRDFDIFIEGTVTYVNSKPVYTPDGGKVVPVEIEIDNPGAIQNGMKAHANVETASGSFISIGTSSFEYVKSMTVRAPASGKMESFILRENQYVYKNSAVMGFTGTGD